MKINVFPKKSASLIILRDNKKINSYYNYEILYIKRTSKLSFSNMHAFPGGGITEMDENRSKIFKVDAYLHCALRETFEETGLFFMKNYLPNLELLEKIK